MKHPELILAGLACSLAGCIGVATDASTHTTTNVENIRIEAVQVQQSATSISGDTTNITIISPDEILEKVIAAKRPFATGYTDSTGLWLISRQKIRLTEKMTNQEAINIAEIRAKQKIAEFLGSDITAHETAYLSVVETDEQKEYKRNVELFVKTETNKVLRGVTLLRAEKKDGYIQADFYTTEKLVQLAIDNIKINPDGGIVQTSGYAMIRNDEVATAKQAALQLALRNAVEQVMGSTVVAQSALMNNSKVKSKVVSQSVGQIKQYRIVREGVAGTSYMVVVDAEVDRDAVLDNYAALVRSMGDPVFFVNTEDPDLRVALNDFMKQLGFKVTTFHDTANFFVDAGCTYLAIENDHYGQGIQIDMKLELLNVKTGELYMTLHNTPRLSSSYSGSFHQIRQAAAEKAFREIKDEFHKKMDAVIVDWVVNGHDLSIVFNQFAGDDKYVKSLEDAINAIPVVKLLSKERNADTLVYKCTCIGPALDVDDFLHEAMSVEFGDNVPQPRTTKIELDEIQLSCSK